MRKLNRSPLLKIGMTLGEHSWRVSLLSVNVHHNSRPGVDFSKYHTSKWVNIEGGAHPNQIVYSLN